jgi:ribosomal-protein-alanine N-acetyltransferase
MALIRTQRLDLIPAPIKFIEALIADEYERAGRLLQVVVQAGWPDDAEARAGLSFHLRAIRSDAGEALWRIRLIVLRANDTIIGSINLKGLPDETGTVEIGWGVSPQYRRRGIATEATATVIDWVRSQPKARRIIATIPTENVASQQVAARLGMQQTAETRHQLPVWELKLNRISSTL